MQNTTIAVDPAKSVFEIAISHRPGVVVERKRLSRRLFASFLANHDPADFVMEACGTAHFWGRKAQEVGHNVRLLPPKTVRPYVRGNKTDRADTKGILEADRNEDIIPVPVKSIEQQALMALHRFPSARHLASFLGLTPREKSSGYTKFLGRITKRGDPYLRTLLIHGGRSLLHHAKRTEEPDRLRAWGLDRERMIGHNKAAIALANKLARIVWAVWKTETGYRSMPQ